MSSNSIPRILVSALLLTLLSLSLATPARAFDGRSADTVNIAAGEVVNDDLYVSAQTFTMDGTVNGDLLAAGNTLTINGTVDGDVMAAGETVIINGIVTGDVRIAGGALFVGKNAKITGDIIAMGASLEMRKGSSNGRDVLFMGGQALLAGDTGRNLKAFTGALQILGSIAGDVETEVGDRENAGPTPSLYLPHSAIPLPNVPPGLTIDPAAKIGGKLIYTSNTELNLPGSVVAGGIEHLKPVVHPEDVVKTLTPAERFATGLFDALRRMVTLVLFGLILGWLFPAFLKNAAGRLQQSPLPALGWGVVSWGAFFFAVLVILVATVLGAIIFGMLTLGGITASIVWLGILSLSILIMGFVLASAYVAQIVISLLGGKLLLARIKPDWVDHKVWPLLIGVIIFATLAALPVIGWLVNLLAILFGLGALWMLGSALFKKQQPAV
jgi:cytoskeletal protein CcmA (bactofilin family)